MAIAQRTHWGRLFQQAVVAGIAGGIIVMLYVWLTTVVPQHGSLTSLGQWVASVAIGKTAFTSASYAWFGLLVHLVVSMAWAGGYAYLAAQRAYMNERWIVSGIVYGFVVYVFMELVLLAAGALKPPATPNAFIGELVTDCIFFGLPVAFVVSRLKRP
jgi:uncharacterized membrane protein YagU involved in acid resistance